VARRSFEAVLQPRGGGGHAIELPFDPAEAFGRKRAPVRGTVNGYPVRSTIAIYGGRAFLGLNRQVREGAGVAAGDRITVELEPDDEPRVVDVPDDLAAAFASDAGARDAFDRLSYTHRREYVEWITEAKRDETRRVRIEKALAMLRAGTKTPG
jgi:hypothetical protein